MAQGPTPVGKIFEAQGQVRITNQAYQRDLAATKGMNLIKSDVIVTGENSQAKLVMADDSLLRVGEESRLEIDQYEFSPQDKVRNVKLNLPAGKLKLMVNDLLDYKERQFQIKTPTAVAGVRGTNLLVVVLSPEQTVILGLDNPVWVANLQDLGITVVVGDNNLTYVMIGQPPSNPRQPTPQELLFLQQLFSLGQVIPPGGPGIPPSLVGTTTNATTSTTTTTTTTSTTARATTTTTARPTTTTTTTTTTHRPTTTTRRPTTTTTTTTRRPTTTTTTQES